MTGEIGTTQKIFGVCAIAFLSVMLIVPLYSATSNLIRTQMELDEQRDVIVALSNRILNDKNVIMSDRVAFMRSRNTFNFQTVSQTLTRQCEGFMQRFSETKIVQPCSHSQSQIGGELMHHLVTLSVSGTLQEFVIALEKPAPSNLGIEHFEIRSPLWSANSSSFELELKFGEISNLPKANSP